MELRYRREVTVGILLVVGTLSFVGLMMYLRGASLGRARVMHATFNDVMGLKEGDPVRTSGVRVGRVNRIDLDSAGRVIVTMSLSRGQPPHRDAEVRIMSADFFGARFVDFKPGHAAALLADDGTISGMRVADVGEMAEQLSRKGNALLDTATATASAVNAELRTTLRQTQTLLTTLNHGAATSTDQLVGTLEDLRHVLQRVDQLVQANGPNATQAMANMRDASAHADSLTRSMQHATAQIDSILAKVNNGHGTAASLLNDTSVVHNLMSTNEALRALLVDFKANPGRYIHVHVF